jgi:hypothetical protein
VVTTLDHGTVQSSEGWAIGDSFCHDRRVTATRTPKAVGTYGFLDAVCHPTVIVPRMVRSPKPSDGQADVEAVRRGEKRIVSCFIRGNFDPFPRQLKQGELVVGGAEPVWTPFWSIKHQPVVLDFEVVDVITRPVDEREPSTRIKQGIKLFGKVVPVGPIFTVVACITPLGYVDFVIPSADGPLVAEAFRCLTR